MELNRENWTDKKEFIKYLESLKRNDKISWTKNILNTNINGITINEGYKRYYPYKDTLKNIFGSVNKITKENKDYNLKKGYDLNDEVGVSGLEL